jgi:predicted Zn-dependent protease with MMP-like domain
MEDLWAMMGNVYDHGNYCEFLLGMYKVEEKPVLDFKRMSGDGFVMDTFYRNVIQELLKANSELIVDVEEDDGDDVFEDYSDDETEDDGRDSEGADLTSYGYLQLSYDESLVTSWIEKIETRHVEDKNHMMGLMAYNALHEENLEIIVRKGGKNLRDLTKLLFEESNSAALVRNTSALVKAVTSVEASKEHGYDAAFVESVFEAMHYWVPNNGRKNKQNASATFEITESRETVTNLVDTLFNLKNFVDSDAISEKAAKLKEDQKANIIAFLEQPQKKTDPAEYLLHILNTTK